MAGGGIKINNNRIVGGADGVTFIPSVDDNGNLSWSNNKGYPNPITVNIKGADGANGKDGKNGAKLVSQTLQGQDANGGNIYKQTFDDGTTAIFVAPRGEQGPAGLTEQQKSKVDKLVIDGNGNKFLADNGEYKEVSGGSSLDVKINGTSIVQDGVANIIPKDIVKEGIVTQTETLTDEEKIRACDWLGAVKKTEIYKITDNTVTLEALPNNEYYYGELVSLNLSFYTPTGIKNVGDMFYITFYSGETPTVLTVDSTNAIFEDFVPNANSYVEIMGKWNGNKWIVLFSQVGV